MKVLGLHFTTNAEGQRTTTLQVAEEYADYYNNPAAGRGCAGMKVDAVYVGTYDCSGIKVGSEIDILYDKAVNGKNGVYQPVKRIDILK